MITVATGRRFSDKSPSCAALDLEEVPYDVLFSLRRFKQRAARYRATRFGDGLMDDTDRRIINGLQGGFPIVERPFAVLSEQFGLDEDDLITRIERLCAEGCLSRFGPMYDADRLGGGTCLAPWRYRKTGSRRSRRKSTRIPRSRTTMPARTHSTCGSSSQPRLPTGSIRC